MQTIDTNKIPAATNDNIFDLTIKDAIPKIKATIVAIAVIIG